MDNQVYYTKLQIIERMQNGEKLRWLSGAVSGCDTPMNEKALFLGAKELNDASGMNVSELYSDKMIVDGELYSEDIIELELSPNLLC